MWAPSLAFLRNPQSVWTLFFWDLQIIWEFVFYSLLVRPGFSQVLPTRSNLGKFFPKKALVCVFLTFSSYFAEMTHAICPPESKISIFLICQQSLCYAGGHKLVAQGCIGVLIVVVWSLCLLRKSLVLSLWQKQVLKDSCSSGLYSFWVELWPCGTGSAFSKYSLFWGIKAVLTE